MTEITAEQAKVFCDHPTIVQQIRMIAQVQAQATYQERLKIEKLRLKVFAMSGAFANEVHLCHESNGLWYDVRIT